jgi:hypothetical protein
MKSFRATGRFSSALFGCLMLALWATSAAGANTLTIDYFTIDPQDADINQLCCGTYNNQVLNSLGPNGLPVLNASYGGPTIHDVLTTTGELTWWSPTLNSHVHATGSATITLPFNVPSDFFPPNGTGSSDASGYQAAILSGTLTVPGTELISFSIGADDSAFAYLDGQVVCDLGGVHGFSNGTCVTPFNISAGTHTIQVFFDDLNAVQSGLYFDVTTQGVTTVPGIPEPESYAMLLAGLGLLGLAARRRKQHRA